MNHPVSEAAIIRPTLYSNNGQCESVTMALGFNVGTIEEGGGCKQKSGGGHYLDSKTPVYHTRLNGRHPWEMLRWV